MKFPHAAKGVSKIFTAEILSLILGVIGGIVSIICIVMNVPANKSFAQSNSDTIGIVLLSMGLVVCVLFLISLILNIIGYLQAAMDEEGFRRAVYCTIFSFLFSMGYYVLINQVGFLGWLGTVMNVIAQILSMLVTIYMIGGLINLSAKCNRVDMVERGSTILKYLIVLYIVSYIIAFIVRFFRETAFSTTVVTFLTAFATVLSVVLYFYQLYYLGKAKKMLSEN